MADPEMMRGIKSTRQLTCKRFEKGGVEAEVVIAQAGERGPDHRKDLAEMAAISTRVEAALEFRDEDAQQLVSVLKLAEPVDGGRGRMQVGVLGRVGSDYL